MTPSAAAAAALAVGMDPPTTPAPPRQWAVQFLGLNITRAYARHLHTCRTRLSSPSTPPNPGYGSLFRYPSHVAATTP
jgi:hypothetical protein